MFNSNKNQHSIGKIRTKVRLQLHTKDWIILEKWVLYWPLILFRFRCFG